MALGDYMPQRNPCTLDEALQALAETYDVLEQLIDIINAGGVADAFTVLGDVGDVTPATLIEKVELTGTYDGGTSHQLVTFEAVDAGGGYIVVRGFTDKGVGAGDNFTVKLDAGGTAGFLDTKIHADTWEPTDTYASATHFVVLAAEAIVSGSPTDAARWYASFSIIKTSAGDGSPGMLAAKFADTGISYDSDDHTPVYANDTGTTMRLFVVNATIETVVQDYLDSVTIGNARYCKVPSGAVNPATQASGDVTPGTCTGLTELVYNSGNGKLEPDTVLTNVVYPNPDPVDIPSGRWKIGTLLPLAGDPTKLALQPLPCVSWPEPD